MRIFILIISKIFVIFSQFEIVGIMTGAKGDVFTNGNDGRAKFYVNNKGVYARILIKHKLFSAN